MIEKTFIEEIVILVVALFVHELFHAIGSWSFGITPKLKIEKPFVLSINSPEYYNLSVLSFILIICYGVVAGAAYLGLLTSTLWVWTIYIGACSHDLKNMSSLIAYHPKTKLKDAIKKEIKTELKNLQNAEH